MIIDIIQKIQISIYLKKKVLYLPFIKKYYTKNVIIWYGDYSLSSYRCNIGEKLYHLISFIFFLMLMKQFVLILIYIIHKLIKTFRTLHGIYRKLEIFYV